MKEKTIKDLLYGITLKEVKGDINCTYKGLTSLDGFPEKVRGSVSVSVSNNKLTSLEGCPKIIGIDLWCTNNQITSLKGCPKIIKRHFSCSDNNLISLENSPEKIGGLFSCAGNQLTSLEYCPKFVGDDFNISANSKKFSKEEVKEFCNVKGNIIV